MHIWFYSHPNLMGKSVCNPPLPAQKTVKTQRKIGGFNLYIKKRKQINIQHKIQTTVFKLLSRCEHHRRYYNTDQIVKYHVFKIPSKYLFINIHFEKCRLLFIPKIKTNFYVVTKTPAAERMRSVVKLKSRQHCACANHV